MEDRNLDRYDPSIIESKWQKIWDERQPFRAQDNRGKKSYVLIEFPYPSGEGLHVGHARSYVALDALARKRRLEGKNVLYPIGFDAFGLPTENYALRTGVHPRVATDKNIANYTRQLKALGLSFDWSRQVDTTDPKYYRWTQWIFLQLLKTGLAYQAEMPINWCPRDKIGLANEEVVGGKCERCGTAVTRKRQKQWMLRITAYAERLLKDLDTVDYLPDIKQQQVNWIGRSEGAEIVFPIPPAGNVVMLHGLTGSPEANFLPLAKDVLSKYRITVQVPSLPNTENPVVMEQVEYVEKNCNFSEATTLLGLSLGSVVALKVTERLKHPIQKLVLVAGFAHPRFKDHPRLFEKTFDWKFDWGKIKRNVSEIVLLHDIRDPAISEEQITELEEKLGAQAIRVEATEPHFDADVEPDVLKTLISDVAVFTTRPDTLFGATYLVLSPEHPLVERVASREYRVAVERYVKQAAAKSDLERTDLAKEKTGVFTGAYAINPANKEQIPIWVADYVLLTYGTGAIMAVPAHDERDWEFAKKFQLTIRPVILPTSYAFWVQAPGDEENAKKRLAEQQKRIKNGDECFIGEGHLINSGKYNGLESQLAKKKITAELAKKLLGKPTIHYKLRDWVFSRQHYWGEPIPVVHCPACKNRVVQTAFHLNFRDQETWQRLVTGLKKVETRALNPDEQERYFGTVKKGAFLACVNVQTNETTYFKVLNAHTFKNLEAFAKKPGLVQKMNLEVRGARTAKELEDDYRFTHDYLDRIKKNGLVAWEIERVIPGVVPVPDKDLPVELPHVEAYEPTDTGESPLAAIPQFVNVKCPECGGEARRETDTMPNWAGSSWYFLRYTDPHNDKVFADQKKLKYWLPVDTYNGGREHTTLHLLYSRFWYKFLFDQGLVPTSEPYAHRHSHGIVLAEDGRKMSKSYGNVINPDDVIKEHGADSLRLFEMFMGPFEDAIPWSTKGLIGMQRFLDRVWRLAGKPSARALPPDVTRLLHQTIRKVSDDLEQFKFNTAVSALMVLAKELGAQPALPPAALTTFLTLLLPFAPHLASELLERLGHDPLTARWPQASAGLAQDARVTVVIQVAGKRRDAVRVPKGSDEATVRRAALALPSVQRHLPGGPARVVFVPDRLINFLP